MTKWHMRSFDEYLEQHFEDHPERVDGFLQTALEEYKQDHDEADLLMALSYVLKAKQK